MRSRGSVACFGGVFPKRSGWLKGQPRPIRPKSCTSFFATWRGNCSRASPELRPIYIYISILRDGMSNQDIGTALLAAATWSRTAGKIYKDKHTAQCRCSTRATSKGHHGDTTYKLNDRAAIAKGTRDGELFEHAAKTNCVVTGVRQIAGDIRGRTVRISGSTPAQTGPLYFRLPCNQQQFVLLEINTW